MMDADTRRRALGARFWRLFGASTASNLADGIGRAVVPLLATTLSRDPVLISALTGLAYLPWLLLALPVGTFVDRSDRRRVMIGANTGRAAAYGVLAVLVATGTATMATLFAVVFLVGVAETLYDSAARAFLPQTVSRDQLDRGNGLLATAETGAQSFLGAPVGALLFAWLAVVPLIGNATAFAVAALLTAAIRGRYRPARPAERTSFAVELREGVRWLWQHRLLRELAAVNGVTSLLQSMPNAVVVLYALEVVHLSPAGFGIIMTATGLGALLGGSIAPWLSAHLGRTTTLAWTSLLFPVPLAAMSLTTDAAIGCTLYGLSAMLVMVGNVLTMSLRQALIPEELFGRVQGSYRTVVWGGIPVGALAGGTLAAATDVPTVFAVAGVAAVVVGVWMSSLLRRHREDIARAYADDGEPAERSD